jgi:pimeloyl-ACP methyl ester carboxylesterase
MSAKGLVTTDVGGGYQTRLAHLWSKNLGVSVGASDDYFENGGDSLRGTELLNWIHEGFGVELSLLDLFECRTIAAQIELLLSRVNAAECATAKRLTEYRFFGPAHARLFGALHNPRSNGGKAGVVLCYPMGQEYMRIHRTYVELARSLADSGLHVLRFDYYGCGDSGGETTDGSLRRWADDVRQAIQELRAQTGVRKVYLVGARIGANLALNVGLSADDLAGVVLWEPIVNGADYVATLKRSHHDLLHSNANLEGYEQRHLPNCFIELVGFPITKELYDEVVAVDLLATPAPKAMPDMLVLANFDKPRLEQFATLLRAGEATLDYMVAGESDGIWLKEDRQNKGLIPAQAVQAIVSWLSRRSE